MALRDITLGLYGAYHLARLNKGAAVYFENTPEAFWRSFQAAIIAIPGYCLLQFFGLADVPLEVSSIRVAFVETSAYVIGWVLFPLIMITVTDAIGKADHYYQFIVAWNWAIVLQIFFYLAVVAIAAGGLLPTSITGFIGFGAVVAFLFYQG